MARGTATLEVRDNGLSNDQGRAACDEHSSLRRVPDRIPWVVLLILIVELGERFTYFGLSAPIQNYIKCVETSNLHGITDTNLYRNPHNPGSDLPGALGKGQAVATALGNFFKFWAYASTVIGAIIADQYLGRFKTIVAACGVYIVGLVILVTTATPAGIESGAGFGGLIAAMVVIGLGTGSIKANVTPMCAEQYRPDTAYTKQLKSGEWVVVDPELTVERMFNWFVLLCVHARTRADALQVLLGSQCWRTLALDHCQR
jgi:POT family proton-dependent oligopeptide transporter